MFKHSPKSIFGFKQPRSKYSSSKPPTKSALSKSISRLPQLRIHSKSSLGSTSQSKLSSKLPSISPLETDSKLLEFKTKTRSKSSLSNPTSVLTPKPQSSLSGRISKAVSEVLTKEEIEEVKKDFLEFDKDGNGFIDRNEFITETRARIQANSGSRRGSQFSDEDLLELFKAPDKNNDGQLSLEDLLEETAKSRRKTKAEIAKLSAEEIERVKREFEDFDKNKEGSIDKEDFVLKIRAQVRGHIVGGFFADAYNLDTIDNLIENLDDLTDMHGRITVEDLLEATGRSRIKKKI